MSSIKYKIPLVRDITKNKNYEFKVISLFAGGGGSSTGYRMAGGKVLVANEFIPEAIKTYQKNWPDTPVMPDDIRSLPVSALLDKAEVDSCEIDILDGSPPCSAFSASGKGNKGWGKTKKYSDKKQEKVEDLFFEYIRILKGVKPKTFVAENVAGLTKGNSKGYFNEIIRGLRSAGYHVECKVLNSKWLGVPQSRNRVIFIGIRNDLFSSDQIGRLHPKPFSQVVTLGDAFKGLNNSNRDLEDARLDRFSIYEYLKQLKRGENHKKRFNLVKTSENKPAPCITATSPLTGAGAACHWDNRAFTVPELKRIMSLPDDYCITGTTKKQHERIGRMVPPLMIKAILMEIPRNWTFKSEEIAQNFDQHVVEQLPWYPLAISMICHLVRCYLSIGATLIDLGCSTGQITKSLKRDLVEREIKAISIDNSKEMLSSFKGYGSKIQCDMTNTEYYCDYDVCVVMLSLMFTNYGERKDFLARLIKKGRKGGAIIIVDKFSPMSGYLGQSISRLAIKGKVDSGVPSDEILKKELSLCGYQRPSSKSQMSDLGFKQWFQIGDFCGFIKEL